MLATRLSFTIVQHGAYSLRTFQVPGATQVWCMKDRNWNSDTRVVESAKVTRSTQMAEQSIATSVEKMGRRG